MRPRPRQSASLPVSRPPQFRGHPTYFLCLPWAEKGSGTFFLTGEGVCPRNPAYSMPHPGEVNPFTALLRLCDKRSMAVKKCKRRRAETTKSRATEQAAFQADIRNSTGHSFGGRTTTRNWCRGSGGRALRYRMRRCKEICRMLHQNEVVFHAANQRS